MNSTSIMGAPKSVMPPASRPACHSGGRPTGMWAMTSDVSKPHKASNMASAVTSDCE